MADTSDPTGPHHLLLFINNIQLRWSIWWKTCGYNLFIENWYTPLHVMLKMSYFLTEADSHLLRTHYRASLRFLFIDTIDFMGFSLLSQ